MVIQELVSIKFSFRCLFIEPYYIYGLLHQGIEPVMNFGLSYINNRLGFPIYQSPKEIPN